MPVCSVAGSLRFVERGLQPFLRVGPSWACSCVSPYAGSIRSRWRSSYLNELDQRRINFKLSTYQKGEHTSQEKSTPSQSTRPLRVPYSNTNSFRDIQKRCNGARALNRQGTSLWRVMMGRETMSEEGRGDLPGDAGRREELP
jgi:hypothetical protein